MAALHRVAARGGRIGKVDEDRPRHPLQLEALAHILRKCIERSLKAAAHRLKPGAESCERAPCEPPDILTTTDCYERFVPLRQYILRLESALRKDRSIPLSLLRHVLPTLVEELELFRVRSIAAAPFQEHCFQQNLRQC